MIYLLSQMILALAVAVVLGVALGWLIHRTTYSQKNHRLKQTIASLHNRLAQTQSEVSMLTDDYDEMQRQSQDQIIALREENRQIPDLNSNLEKSQLLVRQMMQRHETKVRELGKDNQKLSTKLAKLEEQEQTKNQLSAELDKRKRDSAPVESEQASDNQPSDQPQPLSNAPVTPASTQIMDDEDPTKAMRTSEPGIAKPNPGKPALFAAAESDADPFDQVMEVEDELQRELDMTAERKTAASEMDAISDLSDSSSTQSPAELNSELRLNSKSPNSSTSYSAKHSDLNRKAITLNADVTDAPYSEQSDLSQSTDNVDDLDNLIALDDVGEFTDSFSALGDTFSQTGDMDDMDSVDSTHEQTGGTDSTIEQPHPIDLNSDTANTAERSYGIAGEDALQLDGSSDDSMLFEPVSQHDDLQQIFGIGPLTEKALNELGITSYSQLAKLKQQEIQHIADALEIGPGRIERDNWVGNARRQLEDVLEQL